MMKERIWLMDVSTIICFCVRGSGVGNLILEFSFFCGRAELSEFLEDTLGEPSSAELVGSRKRLEDKGPG